MNGRRIAKEKHHAAEALARLINGVNGASSPVAGAGSGSGGSGVDDHSVKANIDTINVITQATDAKGIASSIGDGMDFLFTSQANTGLN